MHKRIESILYEPDSRRELELKQTLDSLFHYSGNDSRQASYQHYQYRLRGSNLPRATVYRIC